MQCTAWGKLTLSESGAATARLPLAHHCADVAAVAEALLRKGAISRRLARLAGLSCLPPELIRALVRTAFLHDSVNAIADFKPRQFPRLTASDSEFTPPAMCGKSRLC
jgi:CRISPR-associated endonuclease/helicase Cas3